MTFIADRTFRLRRLLLGRQKVRRTQLYGVGTAKSGTYSISAMFSRNVAAEHEPQSNQLTEKFFAWQDGRMGQNEMRDWIRARDQELALEVDSSWLNVLILDLLAQEFPDARFVLTIPRLLLLVEFGVPPCPAYTEHESRSRQGAGIRLRSRWGGPFTGGTGS